MDLFADLIHNVNSGTVEAGIQGFCEETLRPNKTYICMLCA